MARSASSRVSAIGFSQNTALPASAAATIRSVWARAVEAMATASTSSAAKSSAVSVVARAPSDDARRSAAPGAGSATTVSWASATRRASVSAWNVPMRPAPISPTRTGVEGAGSDMGRPPGEFRRMD
jgi:hypothetical protein